MNFKIFKIALMNVLKHKRRSSFNALTFAANTIAIITLLGVIRGMYNTMIDKDIDLSCGHLKVYAAEYVKEKAKMDLSRSIKDPEKLAAVIRGLKHVRGAAPRIIKDGTISNMKNKTGVLICGVDMAEEKSVSSILNKLTGSLPVPGSQGIVMGKKLYELFKAGPDTAFMLFGQTMYKANNLVDAGVSAVYSPGFEFMERRMIFMDLKSAERFFDMEGRATEIIIRLDGKMYVGDVKAEIKKILEKDYPGLVVWDWMEEAPELISGMTNDFVMYAIIFCILVFMAVFIVMNTMTISVFERMAEIGTMRAIGFEKEQVRNMFFFEGMLLTLAGIVLGSIFVLPIVHYLNVTGIPLGDSGAGSIEIPFDPVIRSVNLWLDWIASAIVCMCAGALGSILPANRASKTDIVEALKRGVK